jgi:hypothetical protein
MASRSRQAPPSNLTGLIVTVTILVGCALLVFGYPGLALLPVGFTLAGILVPMPEMTGKRDSTGRPRPIDSREEARLNSARAVSSWKMMLLPTVSWLPGWPVLGVWLIATSLAGLTLLLPAARDPWDLLDGALDPLWAAVANALGVYLVVMHTRRAAMRFATTDEPSPGVRVSSLTRFMPPRPGLLTARPVAGGEAWWQKLRGRLVTGLWSAAWPTLLSLGAAVVLFGLGVVFARGLVAADESLVEAVGFGLTFWQVPPVVFGICLAVLLVCVLLWVSWSKVALLPFRQRVAARTEWKPRWEGLRLDPAPRLVDYREVGPARVTTFDAPAGQSATTMIAMAPKIAPSVGAGMQVSVLEVENTDSKGQPIPGSTHPQRFSVVAWPMDQTPDVEDPTIDQEVLELAVRTAIARVCDAEGYARIRIKQILPLHGEDSEKALWHVAPLPDAFPLMVYFRDAGNHSAIGPSLGTVSAMNHRESEPGGPAFFIGAIGDEGFVPDERAQEVVALVENSLEEDLWNSRWGGVLKSNVNMPRPDHLSRTQAQLASGATIHRQPFIVLAGERPDDYFGLEQKLRSTSLATTFVSTTGFLMPGQPERHPQGVVVNWVEPGQQVPRSPAALTPPRRLAREVQSMPEAWVLSGMINEAFDAARLPRPEVFGVRALTPPTSDLHLWEVKLRLYGGVTLDAVQRQASKLREVLQSPWVRLTTNEHGITLFAGASPDSVKLALERRDRPQIVALDWAQAFADSRVRGAGGELPRLESTHTLEHNEKVRSIDFALPPGTDVSTVRAATGKLQSATGNAFIDVRQHPESASKVRMLVSETDPMPQLVPYPFEQPLDDSGGLRFGAGVDGQIVSTEFGDNPHLLILGSSGSGKTITLLSFIYGAFASGARVVAVDVQKQGADFAFARPYCSAFATTLEDARAALEAVYAESLERSKLNAQYAVGNFRDLPEEVRPDRIVIVMDEFLGLVTAGSRPPSQPEKDREAEEARLELVAAYENKNRIAFLAGRIAAESRAAGISLVLATQVLKKDSMPAAMGDLKTNMARIIQGKHNYGDKVSALRDPDSAPDLGEVVPKGRLIFEPVGTSSYVAQACFAPVSEFEQQLALLYPDPSVIDRLDLDRYRPVKKTVRVEGEEIPMEELEQPLMIDALDLVLTDHPSDDDADELPSWARAWADSEGDSTPEGSGSVVDEPETGGQVLEFDSGSAAAPAVELSFEDALAEVARQDAQQGGPGPELIFELAEDTDAETSSGEEEGSAGSAPLLCDQPGPPAEASDTTGTQDAVGESTSPGRARSLVGEAETVVLWGFDGVLALPPDTTDPEAVLAGPGRTGPVLVDEDLAARALRIDAAHAWLTDTPEAVADLVPDLLEAPRLEVVAAGGPDDLTGPLLAFLEAHPFVTALTLVHPALAEPRARAEAARLLEETSIRHLLIAPDPQKGVGAEELGAATRFCAGEPMDHLITTVQQTEEPPVVAREPAKKRAPAKEGKSRIDAGGAKNGAAFAEFDQKVLSVSSPRGGRRRHRTVLVEDIDEF